MILSVIIPTCNGRSLLKKSLPKLFNALKRVIGWEVIVVDNNSNDDTYEFVNQLHDIKYIKLDDNLGFTKAVNQGAITAKGKFLLILNNDCILQKDTIKKMLELLDKNGTCVATQPVVYDKNHEIENIGYNVDLWKGKAEPVKESTCHSEVRHLADRGIPLLLKGSLHSPDLVGIGRDDNALKNIFKQKYLYGLSATCLLIRRDIFMKIGMFDESFHSYLEDVDLFIRLAKAGYCYSPTLNARCYHMHMATSKKMGNYKVWQDLKNWIRIIIKNYSFRFIIVHSPSLLFERLRNISGLIKKTVKILLWM